MTTDHTRIVALLSVLLTAWPASAQPPVPLGPELRVNTTTAGFQGESAVCGSEQGFVVVWRSDGQDGDAGGIYGQRFNPSGEPQGGELLLNDRTGGDQRRPEVVCDQQGSFVAVWENVANGPTGSDIYVKREGSRARRVNITTASDQAFPAIAMARDGSFTVLWESTGQDGDRQGVFARRYASDALPTSGEIQVNTTTTHHQGEPDACYDPLGNLIVVWESLNQDASGWGVYAQRYDRNGIALGGEFRVNTDTLGHQRFPTVGCRADGTFLVAWDELLAGTPGQVRVEARSFDSSGAPTIDDALLGNTYTPLPFEPLVQIAPNIFEDAFLFWRGYPPAGFPAMAHLGRVMRSNGTLGPILGITSLTPSSDPGPSVTMLGPYSPLVTWNTSSSGDASNVHAQRIRLPHSTGEFLVNTHLPGQQIQPEIASGPLRRSLAVWSSEGQDGAGSGIFAQLLDSQARRIGSEFRVNAETTGRQMVPSVMARSNGDFVVTWIDDGGTTFGRDQFGRRCGRCLAGRAGGRSGTHL